MTKSKLKHLPSSTNFGKYYRTVISEYASFIFSLQGVRVVLAANFPTEKLSSKEVRTKWIHNLTQEALARHADGVNIDIESPIAKRSREVTLLTKLVNETATAFRSAIKNSQVYVPPVNSSSCHSFFFVLCSCHMEPVLTRFECLTFLDLNCGSAK